MRPIQFDETHSSPVPNLKVTSFSNWGTARPIQFDVTYSMERKVDETPFKPAVAHRVAMN